MKCDGVSEAQCKSKTGDDYSHDYDCGRRSKHGPRTVGLGPTANLRLPLPSEMFSGIDCAVRNH
jgi:hypothetical protein